MKEINSFIKKATLLDLNDNTLSSFTINKLDSIKKEIEEKLNKMTEIWKLNKVDTYNKIYQKSYEEGYTSENIKIGKHKHKELAELKKKLEVIKTEKKQLKKDLDEHEKMFLNMDVFFEKEQILKKDLKVISTFINCMKDV